MGPENGRYDPFMHHLRNVQSSLLGSIADRTFMDEIARQTGK
jgi:hypothetical protein